MGIISSGQLSLNMNMGMNEVRPLQVSNGACEYWIRKEFQVCLKNTTADCDLVSPRPLVKMGRLRNGFAEEYKRVVYSLEPSFKAYERGSHGQGTCREHGMMHIQAWKRNLYAWMTRVMDRNNVVTSNSTTHYYNRRSNHYATENNHANEGMSLILITDSGFIPLK